MYVVVDVIAGYWQKNWLAAADYSDGNGVETFGDSPDDDDGNVFDVVADDYVVDDGEILVLAIVRKVMAMPH